MRFDPDDKAANATEAVMARLGRVGVLNLDEPGYPVNYNRAFSAVYETMRHTLAGEPKPAPQPAQPTPAGGFPDWLKGIEQRRRAKCRSS